MSEPGSRPDVVRSVEELIAIARADLKLTPEVIDKIKDQADPRIVQMCMEHFGRKALEDIGTIRDEQVKRKYLASAPDDIRSAISHCDYYSGVNPFSKRIKRPERNTLSITSWESSREKRAENAGIASAAIGGGNWWHLIADVRRNERFPFGQGASKIHDEFRQGVAGAYKPIQQYLGEDPQFLGQLRKEIESRHEELGKLWQRDPNLVLRELDNTAQENGYKWNINENRYE